MAEYDPAEFFGAERFSGGSFEMTLHNPLTEDEWDAITDVDFDHTNSIKFHTKHGKTVRFVKDTNVPDKNVAKSNADRIRAYSDEELAKWLENIDTAFEPETIVSQCGWLEWLKSPVEGTE